MYTKKTNQQALRYKPFLPVFCTLFILVITAFSLAFAANPKIDISNVRLGVHPDKTRVVIESDAPLTAKLFTLPNPPRVVIDVPESKVDIDLANMNIPQGSVVKGLRAGLFKAGTTRLVIDTSRAVSVSKQNLSPRGDVTVYRLVVDLASTASAPEIQPDATEPAEPPKLAETPKAVPHKPLVVVIDPGHGGVDPGAVTKKGTYEKNVVLAVGKKVATELSKRDNVVVYMTREDDRFIPLAERVAFAQKKRADIFVSIHADAHKSPSVKGGSVYVVSDKASDREAARLAQDANAGDLIAGLDLSNEAPEVRNILIDLTQRETRNRSVYLAQSVLGKLDDIAYVRKPEPQFAGFRVLRAAEIPSVLVELAYLSNPDEAKLLVSSDYQTKLAKSITNGIENFAHEHVHKH